MEVNAHNLFSESGKTVASLFSKITELLEDGGMVFVLIDEVESTNTMIPSSSSSVIVANRLATVLPLSLFRTDCRLWVFHLHQPALSPPEGGEREECGKCGKRRAESGQSKKEEGVCHRRVVGVHLPTAGSGSP